MRDDGLQLGTRDKVVQKMTREGAVEKNLSEHSERRVSERASDADFSHVRENEQLAGERLDSGSPSGSKIQQRRYHLDDSGGNGDFGSNFEYGSNRDHGSELAGNNLLENNLSEQIHNQFSDQRNLKDVSGSDSYGNRSSPYSGSHRLSDRSVHSENVDSDSRRHQQKKRMSLRYQKENQGRLRHEQESTGDQAQGIAASEHALFSEGEKSPNQKQKQKQNQKQRNKKNSRLNFEEGNSKGSNLGGRFSTVTSGAGKAAGTVAGAAGHVAKQGAISGQNTIKSAFEDGNQEEQDLSEDVVSGSETAASATAHKLAEKSSKRRYSSEKSKRADKLEQTAEARASRLHFESAMESEAAGKSAKDAAKEAAKKNSAKEARRHARNKRYASIFRSKRKAEAAGGTAGKAAEGTLTLAERIKNTVVNIVKKNKGLIAALLAALLFFMILAGSITSMGSVFAGMSTTVFQSTYLASDDELKAAEEAYCEMEEDLQRQIDNIESRYPGYDEYRYQVDEISHNPYQLASYLTVKFGNFKASDAKVQKELKALFNAQYGITIDGGMETITETKTVRVDESLGQVVTSGYCNCSICCGRWAGGATASGVYPTANHTIAVDASNPTVPMGTKVIMNGVEYTVEDTGNFARYGVDFDVYYDSHAAASAHGHQTWEAYLADDNGTQEVEVTTTRTVNVLNTTMTNGGFDAVARARLGEDDAINWYNILNTSYGNRDYLWDKTSISGYTPDGMSYSIPPEALNDTRFRNMITEAEKYLGYPYVWGGASPSTSFDCSGFVSWVINNCGNGWDVGRQTAEGLRNSCTYVSPDQAKPGDLIFFQGTYDTAGASHVGIYVGNGMMIHCGNPIQYASIETSYWQQHFYCFGRLPN